VDDARLGVALSSARGGPTLARAPGCRTPHRASRSGRGRVAIVSMELLDLLLEPSQVLLDVGTLSLERLYDLLNTRQANAPLRGGTRDSGIDVLAEDLLGGA